MSGTAPAADRKPVAEGGSRREERALRAAFAVSSTGDWIFRFALPLLVLQESGSAMLAAVTYAVEYVPYLFFGLVSGVVADRSDRRRLIVGCDALSAVISCVLTVLCLTDGFSLYAVMALAFLLSSIRPFHFPSFQGLLSERVPEDRRPVMNAWLQGTDSFLSLLGPVAGAAIVVFVGPAIASGLNAASFAASALLVWVLRGAKAGAAAPAAAPGEPAASRRGAVRAALGSIRPDFVAGLRVLAANPAVLWGTVLLTVTNFAMLTVQSNLAFLTAGPTGSETSRLAVALVAQGGGALLGSVLAPALLRRWPAGPLVAAGMGVLALALGLPALSHATVPLSAALFLSGLATSAIVVPWRTYRQDVVPEAYIGRVVSVQRTVGFALNPVGAVVGGLVLSSLGPAAIFLVAGAVQTAVWLCAWRGPVGRAGLRPAGSPALLAAGAAPPTRTS
ncbi:MFS transporter [Streptomyces hydrogenans]|uniref:MFS transporter n=1 Tax=Streptomyces hydrogenans TaxID=1873719 RepID=UPI0036EB3F66